MRTLGGIAIIPHVIHLSGTLKKAQLATIAHNRTVVARKRTNVAEVHLSRVTKDSTATLVECSSLPLSSFFYRFSGMEEDASGDIGLSGLPCISKLDPISHVKNTRRAPPAMDLSQNNASHWKTPSPGSPTVLSPTSPTMSTSSSPPSRLNRSRTMPRLNTRLEPQIHDIDGEDAEALVSDRIAGLNRWVASIAVVDFDLDVGPVVAKLYPNIRLDAPDRENIAFSSFPDTTLFDTGTQTHSFKIRLSNPLRSVAENSVREYDTLYGYASFMQRKDPSSKRGYLQRSVVILTHLPWVGLFDRAIGIFGSLFFTHGNAMLQSACLNISNWPDPTLGSVLELGLLGSVITAEIPRSEDQQQQRVASRRADDTLVCPFLAFNRPFLTTGDFQTIATLPSQCIVPLLTDSLPKLWSLWECLVLCDPILIFAPSPSMSSAVVWWLRDLMRPLPFAGDVRPYFHIHDRDFPILMTKNTPRPGLIIGVTNPYFENVCRHWPHILSVGSLDRRPKPTISEKHAPALPSQAFGPSLGYHTGHNRYISKDRAFLKRLEAAVKQGPDAQTQVYELLRQHFAQRSQQLLVPLNRYFSSLLPKPIDSNHSPTPLLAPSPAPSLRTPSPATSAVPPSSHRLSPTPPAPGRTITRVKPFNSKDFFASLKTHGAQLPFRSTTKQKEFYERWLKSPAFGAWISGRVDAAQSVLVRAKPE
ncbi:Polarity axis stabilization protein [Ceratobasidium theobromae]|uniref:Polarity axis stabilization protein n=1 Tax=Ceratobasidium theobromae TaxID=1582974 RepID=A0A5N5QVI9_9AGAM|nr:Polarity axis stabilization protein [Ceratobasidium theobromae]